MYAIVQDGAHQYKVEKGTVLWFESKDDKKAGDKVEFPVLLVADGQNVKVGQPVVNGAKAVGEVVEQARGEKVRVFKYRKREDYHRRRGHRQNYTVIKITDILPG
jgi:large subunit ribosomal protein L21